MLKAYSLHTWCITDSRQPWEGHFTAIYCSCITISFLFTNCFINQLGKVSNNYTWWQNSTIDRRQPWEGQFNAIYLFCIPLLFLFIKLAYIPVRKSLLKISVSVTTKGHTTVDLTTGICLHNGEMTNKI